MLDVKTRGPPDPGSKAIVSSRNPSRVSRRCDRFPDDRGFTLIEVVLVATILGILTSMSLPQLSEAREKAQIARAIGDIRAIGWAVMEEEIVSGAFPSSLAAVGWSNYEDPWGNPYRYLKIKGSSGGLGGMRKDRFLVPINSDFDLYSMGPDGNSAPPLTAKNSRDDIIRANDGGFTGEAEK